MTKPLTPHKTPHRSACSGLILAVLSLGCGDTAAPPDPPRVTTVDVVDNRFSPSANVVGVGATVTWSWQGSNPHNVTFDDPAIENSVTQTAGSFERTFDEAGEYTYFCTVHGRAVMSGRVVVGDEGTANPMTRTSEIHR